MKAKWVGILILLVVLVASFAVVGQAAASSTTDQIINDAADGTLDGNYSTAQVEAALEYVRNNPLADQYSGVEGVLEDYLGGVQAPGAQGGELAFTGGEIVLILGAGLGLVGSGAFLRRRSRA